MFSNMCRPHSDVSKALCTVKNPSFHLLKCQAHQGRERGKTRSGMGQLGPWGMTFDFFPIWCDVQALGCPQGVLEEGSTRPGRRWIWTADQWDIIWHSCFCRDDRTGRPRAHSWLGQQMPQVGMLLRDVLGHEELRAWHTEPCPLSLNILGACFPPVQISKAQLCRRKAGAAVHSFIHSFPPNPVPVLPLLMWEGPCTWTRADLGATEKNQPTGSGDPGATMSPIGAVKTQVGRLRASWRSRAF